MLFSRTIARRRIAAGTRPGWFAAWGPVAADATALVLVLLLAFAVLIAPLLDSGLARPVLFVLLFIVFFLPVQVVLIVSALWATKSRWTSGDVTNSQQQSRPDHF